jgi:hypothetical protein
VAFALHGPSRPTTATAHGLLFQTPVSTFNVYPNDKHSDPDTDVS